jgi:hypothetical protein
MCPSSPLYVNKEENVINIGLEWAIGMLKLKPPQGMNAFYVFILT